MSMLHREARTRRAIARLTLALALSLLAPVAAAPLLAQRPAANPLEIGFAAGISNLPDALGTQCGTSRNGGSDPAPEIGASLLRRIGHHLALQLDTRATFQLGIFGCSLVLPAIDTVFDRSVHRDPLVTSTLRIAAETPPSMPLFRVAAGGGVAWGGPPLGIGVASIAWSTRGVRRRFFVEMDWLRTRVHGEEWRIPMGPGETASSRPIVTTAIAQTVRVGLSFRRAPRG